MDFMRIRKAVVKKDILRVCMATLALGGVFLLTILISKRILLQQEISEGEIGNLMENSNTVSDNTEAEIDDSLQMAETEMKSELFVNDVSEADFNALSGNNFFILREEYYNGMSREEILNYFGMELDLSEVLPEYHESTDAEYGFYGFPDGSILDQQSFVYTNGKSQKLTITVRMDQLPITSIVGSYRFGMESCVVEETEMVIVHYMNLDGVDFYHAEIMIGNLGITITTEGMGLEELQAVVEYLLGDNG